MAGAVSLIAYDAPEDLDGARAGLDAVPGRAGGIVIDLRLRELKELRT
jgi:hypothetical protein